MASLIEPTNEDLEVMNGLDNVALWARLDGPVDHPGSMAGSLFELMGTPPITANMAAAGECWEALLAFANIDPTDFADSLREWKYADLNVQEERDGPSVQGTGYVHTVFYEWLRASEGSVVSDLLWVSVVTVNLVVWGL